MKKYFLILMMVVMIGLLFTSCSTADEVNVDTSNIIVKYIYYGEHQLDLKDDEKAVWFSVTVDNNTEYDLVSINFAKPSEDYSFLEASYYTVSAKSNINSSLQKYVIDDDVDEETAFEQLQKEDFSITFTINGKRYTINGEWENHAGEDPIPE